MKRSIICYAAALALTLSGCSGTSTAPSTTAEESIHTTTAPAVETTEAPTEAVKKRTTQPPETNIVTDTMYEHATALWPAFQNTARLIRVMEKAEAGEPITIGVIGGSITERFSATSEEKSYAQIMLRWWKTTFPDCDISFVNAGIGSTDSYLGVHRVNDHLLSYEPDFVIVEFSVNDSGSMFYRQTYENLVYKILSSKKDPAVLLLFMTQETGVSTQESNIEIGKQYKLPMLSYRNAVLPEIASGNFTWKDISPDNIHPNNQGHAICGELIWRYLNNVYENLEEQKTSYPEYSIPAKAEYLYADAAILDSNGITPDKLGSFAEGSSVSRRFSHGWNTSGGDEGITFTIECRNLGILFYKTTSAKAGQFDVYIDGEYKTTIDSSFPGGWGNYEAAQEIFSDDAAKTHTVELRRSADSTGDVFSLLGWLVS